jgi:hypothetical protein
MPIKAGNQRKARPVKRADELVSVRLPPRTIEALDRWAKRLDLTRSEAIRRLLNGALTASRAASKLNVTRRE